MHKKAKIAMKKAALFLNGSPPCLDNIDLSNTFVACADGAYSYLMGRIEPDLLVGDFDSLDICAAKLSKKTKVISYSTAKNLTDGFLALKELAKIGISNVKIYGAFGGRRDHELYNYSLLALSRELNIDSQLVGDDFVVSYCDDRVSFSSKKGAIISIVPYSDFAHILYTKGLTYECDNLMLTKTNGLKEEGFVMGVSNEASSDSVEIQLKEGSALIFAQIIKEA